jgi:hypothetical protein
MSVPVKGDITSGVITIVRATIIGVCGGIGRQEVVPEVIRAIHEIPGVITITLQIGPIVGCATSNL